ncbi:MAG TPA: choice-of-anchor U domain-containing protein [Gammaproteobacteria bacterium]
MKIKQNLIQTAILLATSTLYTPAFAAMPTDAILEMSEQTYFCDYGLGTYPDCMAGAVVDANYFGMDTSGDGTFQNGERTGIEAGTDNGLILGLSQAAGEIDSEWTFFSNSGWHITSSPITIATDDNSGNVTLDMTGWRVFWNGVTINMGLGDDAVVTCGNTCEDGDTFTLEYSAIVPDDGQTNFGNVPYSLFMSGTIKQPIEVIIDTGGTLTCGDTALSSGATTATDCKITSENIGIADTGDSDQQGIEASCIGGCFDFEITGLTPGAVARAVLPLSVAIPEVAKGHTLRYRKLDTATSTWRSFDSSGDNAIHTAPGTISGSTTTCPAATDAIYNDSRNLTPGHACVRLTIVDGGPNDADGIENGTIVDPGGIADTYEIDTRVASTDGCSMSSTPAHSRHHADWWIVAAFLSVLGIIKLKRKKAE